MRLLAAKAGKYKLKTASGKTLQAELKELPGPVIMGGPWDLQLPTNAGAPVHLRLGKLISWPEHPEPGVKYFSGAATYSNTLHLPNEFVRRNRRVFLDLGRVQVIAEVKVNGRDFGILWKPPFEAEVTEAIHAGDNALEIKVVNLWPNRLIGDEQLAEDCRWRPAEGRAGQALASWPSWLAEGKPSPTGRLTFATRKLWTRDSPLLESGLLGPVILRAADELIVE